MKGKITIEDKEYKLPLSYNDVTLLEFKRIQSFIDLNKSITDYIIGDEKAEEPTEEALINYYVGFISVVTGIPKSTVMRINRYTDEDSIGIEDLFASFTWLFLMPKEEEAQQPIDKIGKYYFIDKSGIMKDNSLVEYTEANTVTNALSKLQEGRYEYLNLLLAIFYRPKKRKWFKSSIIEYDSEDVTSRAKEFDSLTMDVVFNCMFFFIQSRKNFLKNTEESLVVELEKARKQVLD